MTKWPEKVQKTKDKDFFQFALSGRFKSVQSLLLRVVKSLLLPEMEKRHLCSPDKP